ncbi:LacI family DNA-binding transcriptional regulator [Vitiosangium sp. GDMCC 1.1324]|uniref:LacI family DNA-binding transcriptional regulator n=1 Tax=Vitiosangium sp. (strain GDMCC 1.1324) TaxID=2138576 RepID=UPI000D33ADBB|nr:substrate-binding domain-containing protein [Vitiosangium sp. GDMCC 1.1324]PTL78513.1 transcriptional regulator [Vitiosangium sp. GDMCC 1.1324]
MDGRGPNAVTLEEVARRAGVSPSTVSRILNGTARVRESKRQAVEQAIADLDYRPNVMAQGLARGSSMSVGVITQDIASPFYNESLKGIEDSLAGAGSGYAPLFVSGHWKKEKEAECLSLLAARRVDGLVVLTGVVDDATLLDHATRMPLVITGRNLQGPNVVSIHADNEQAGFDATQHLIELGHTRIAHISGPEGNLDAQARLAGYRRALKEANLPVEERLIATGDFHETGGLLAVNQLLETRLNFTALFVANDQMAYGARLVLYRKGIRVPEDVSIIGFDDLPASLYSTPPLTTVRQPAYDLGKMAGDAILRLIHGQKVSIPTIPLQVIVRESTMRRRGT